MTVRNELHQLADTLPEPAAQALLEYARWLAAHEGRTMTEAERLGGAVPAATPGHPQSLAELLHELLGDSEGESQTGA